LPEADPVPIGPVQVAFALNIIKKSETPLEMASASADAFCPTIPTEVNLEIRAEDNTLATIMTLLQKGTQKVVTPLCSPNAAPALVCHHTPHHKSETGLITP